MAVRRISAKALLLRFAYYMLLVLTTSMGARRCLQIVGATDAPVGLGGILVGVLSTSLVILISLLVPVAWRIGYLSGDSQVFSVRNVSVPALSGALVLFAISGVGLVGLKVLYFLIIYPFLLILFFVYDIYKDLYLSQ